MGNCTRLYSYSSINSPASPRIHPRPTSPPQLPKPSDEDVKVTIHHASNIRMISSSQLSTITKNFSNKNLIGRGGFGPVYKGTVRLDPKLRSRVGNVEVAVKRVGSGSDQGRAEWLAEISFLRQLKQENLVKLIGYSEDDYPRCLIYEYHSRGRLARYLYSDAEEPLTWTIRKKIARGAAKGLAYMHSATKPVILRDFKASNILLDEEYTPKLCDFGLARIGPQTNQTHVSTRIVGTPGYIDPGYEETGHLTAKSDVYTFGVLLLEILTGKKAMEFVLPEKEDLATWARPKLLDKERCLPIIDPRLKGYDAKEICEFAKIAHRCVRRKPKNRPSMRKILETLMRLDEH